MEKKTLSVLTYIDRVIAISWKAVAPILDIVVYAEPVNLVFTQGIVATIMNAISIARSDRFWLVLVTSESPVRGAF